MFPIRAPLTRSSSWLILGVSADRGMKFKNAVWAALILGCVMSICGLLGFYALMPDKSDPEGKSVLCLLCAFVFAVGLLLIGAALLAGVIAAVRSSLKARGGR